MLILDSFIKRFLMRPETSTVDLCCFYFTFFFRNLRMHFLKFANVFMYCIAEHQFCSKSRRFDLGSGYFYVVPACCVAVVPTRQARHRPSQCRASVRSKLFVQIRNNCQNLTRNRKRLVSYSATCFSTSADFYDQEFLRVFGTM